MDLMVHMLPINEMSFEENWLTGIRSQRIILRVSKIETALEDYLGHT